MWIPFELDRFIGQQVTCRPTSLFQGEMDDHALLLAERIRGRRVLVTGGAGTIGRAFIRALLRFRPAALVVVDRSENGLAELVRDLRSTAGQYIPPLFCLLPLDVGGPVFPKLLTRSAPFGIVAHFAAYKHVRSAKDAFSTEALLRNNVLATHRLLEGLLDRPPQHFFAVSTDKAARPVNAMGASKKLMEDVLLAYAGLLPVSSARFANVAFSQGSLPDAFLRRLALRQPLSAPRDIRRYFLSPQEAGQLCLLTCMLAAPGERFFPKLDRQSLLSFATLADRLLAYLGLEAMPCASEEEARRCAAEWYPGQKHYPVYFFDSDTSGEKPEEEFFTPTEVVDTDRFPHVGVLHPPGSAQRIPMHGPMQDLEAIFQQPDLTKFEIIAFLEGLVPSFGHRERGRQLDERM
jgi:FlaA1/EpsC-like NDP-sugar epimerase